MISSASIEFEHVMAHYAKHLLEQEAMLVRLPSQLF
jgi:hypothetical protein